MTYREGALSGALVGVGAFIIIEYGVRSLGGLLRFAGLLTAGMVVGAAVAGARKGSDFRQAFLAPAPRLSGVRHDAA